jgi:hypothetical protein
MVSKIMEYHHTRKIPVFVKAREIIGRENVYSIEEILRTIDELSEYGNEIKKIKRQIIMATDTDLMSILIERARSV